MRIYFQSRFLLVGLLGFFSGLPLALTGATLTAWLADAKVDRAAIGLFAAVATPYAFKFLWSPLLDGVRLPWLHGWLGRRRSWLLLTQCLLVASMLLMGITNPALNPWLTALAALLVAICSATQDTVIDAYRVELLTPDEQGTGAAAATFGYRIAMLVSGAGALYAADRLGWHGTYVLMACIMALGLFVTLAAKEEFAVRSLVRIGDSLELGKEKEKFSAQQRHSSLSSELRTPNSFFHYYVLAPMRDFMTRPYWLAILAFVILYKLGDAFMGVMFNPFLLDIGFTKTQIAEIVKFYGLVATLIGSFVGGAVVRRLSLFPALFLSGLLHMATNLLLVVQARLGADAHFLIVSISLENFTGGMSTTAFVAYLAGLTRRHYTATQYALLSSLSAFGRTWLSTPSGLLAKTLGWAPFFAVASLMALPGLALLVWLERKNRAVSPEALG